jgi:hypothetical protein
VTHSLASSIGRNGEGLEANRGEESDVICHLSFAACHLPLHLPFAVHFTFHITHFALETRGRLRFPTKQAIRCPSPYNPQFAIRNPQLKHAVAFGSPLNGAGFLW